MRRRRPPPQANEKHFSYDPNRCSTNFSVPLPDSRTLALLLPRCSAILIFFLAGLEKLLKLTSKLWVQPLENSKVLFCVGSSPHLCKEYTPILIGLGHIRFQLDGLTVVFKRFRIVLRALLSKCESEVIMRLSK